jgi:hypothetical protein
MVALRGCLARFSEPHQELLLAPHAGDGRVCSIAEQSGKSAKNVCHDFVEFVDIAGDGFDLRRLDMLKAV